MNIPHNQHSLLQASSGQQMLGGADMQLLYQFRNVQLLCGAIMHYLLCGNILGRATPMFKSDGNIV